MKLLVCIKQIGDDGEMNRFDAHALEEALLLKEQTTTQRSEPAVVHVVTVGPPAAEKIIRRAFGMGADRGYHIVTKDTGYVSPFMTASRLSALAEKTTYDLILTGIMSEDMMTGQTGPMMAGLMKLPCATGVVKTRLSSDDAIIAIEREMEEGFRDCLSILLPAVLTIQVGINTPRYPSLSNLLAAKKKHILGLTPEGLFPEPVRAKEAYVGRETPEKTRPGRVLEGSLPEKAAQLFSFLKEKDLI